MSNTPQYSFLCFIILYQYYLATIAHFCTTSFPIHPFRGVHWCSRKKVFRKKRKKNFWKHPSISVSKNKQRLWKFLENSHVGVLFKFIFRLFWTFWKKLFRAAILYESVSICFCQKEFHSRCYLRNFKEFWKYARQRGKVRRPQIY